MYQNGNNINKKVLKKILCTERINIKNRKRDIKQSFTENKKINKN